MITIKSKREIELMKEAGRIVALVLATLEEIIQPGITTAYLDKIASEIIIANKAKPAFLGYGGFPATICASVNDNLIHGIPNQKKLAEGDILSIDVGAVYQGYYGDAARTYPVGSVSSLALRIIEVSKNSFYEGIKYVRAGNKLGDVSAAIGLYVRESGYSVPSDYCGHGIGTALHEEPAVHNQGEAGTGIILKSGMVLAIEPMVLSRKATTYVAADNWAVMASDKGLTSHYENTVLIKEDGYEILTI